MASLSVPHETTTTECHHDASHEERSFLANVYHRSDGAPAWFDLFAQEKLFETAYSGFYFCAVTWNHQTSSSWSQQILKHWELMFLLTTYSLEALYLYFCNATIGEKMYGLERRLFRPQWIDLGITETGTVVDRQGNPLKDVNHSRRLRTELVSSLHGARPSVFATATMAVAIPYLKLKLREILLLRERHARQTTATTNQNLLSYTSLTPLTNLAFYFERIKDCATRTALATRLPFFTNPNLHLVTSIRTRYYYVISRVKMFLSWLRSRYPATAQKIIPLTRRLTAWIFELFHLLKQRFRPTLIFIAVIYVIVEVLFKLLYFTDPQRYPFWNPYLRYFHSVLRYQRAPIAEAIRERTLGTWFSRLLFAGFYILRIGAFCMRHSQEHSTTMLPTSLRNNIYQRFLGSTSPAAALPLRPPPIIAPLTKTGPHKNLSTSKLLKPNRNSQQPRNLQAITAPFFAYRTVYLPQDPRICALCLKPRRLPVASSGGFVFCYLCLTKWLETHATCPISGLPMSQNELRRLREPERQSCVLT